MRKLNPHERQLVSSIEGAIKLTRTGVSPNEAITKVAREEGRGPEYIRRMVEGYNKSKSVDYLSKTAADLRASAFDLADFDKIAESIYVAPLDKAASEFAIPTQDFSLADLHGALHEKVASALPPSEEKTEHRFTTAGKLEKQAHLIEGVQQRLHNKVQESRYNLHRTIEKVAEMMAPYSEKNIRKVAQKVVNGFPENGGTFVQLIGRKMNREVPSLDKTANSTVFPTSEPYLSICKVFEYAEKLAHAEVEKTAFDKTASGLLDSIKGSSIANALTGIESGPKSDGFSATSVETLDPRTYNKLKGLDARRSFLNLALYDKDLQQYDISDLEDAYNTTVATIPDAYDNPTVLRNTMLRNLQGSGKEPFELKTELEIQKLLSGKGSKEEEGGSGMQGAVR